MPFVGPQRKKLLPLLSSALPLVIAGVLLFLTSRGVDWQEVLRTLGGARWPYLILATLVLCSSLFLRAARWRILLGNGRPLPLLAVFWTATIGYLGNNFLPARSGDLIRSLLVGHNLGLSKSFAIATTLTERLVDAIALVLISTVALVALGTLSDWVLGATIATAVIGLLGCLALYAIPRQQARLTALLGRLPISGSRRDRVLAAVAQFLIGMSVLARSGTPVRFAGLTTVIWLLDGIGSVIVSRALEVPELGLLQGMLLLAALGLSSALPSTPGYVGIYQFVAVSLLPLFSFSQSQALSYILIWQALGYVVITTFGLLGVWRVGTRAVKEAMGANKVGTALEPTRELAAHSRRA